MYCCYQKPELIHFTLHAAESCSAASTIISEYDSLGVAINIGDWDAAIDFLRREDGAKIARISASGRRVLHVAVFAGRTEIVEKLVEELSAEELKIQDDYGLTALAQVVILQNIQMLECMLTKCADLLTLRDREDRIPLITALEFGNIAVARYLYFFSLRNYQTLGNIDASTALTRFILLNNFGKDPNYSFFLSSDAWKLY